MHLTKGKKAAAAMGAGALAVAASGVAYAYYTSNGSGTGSATSKANTAVTLTGITVGGLAPNVTKTIPFSFTNTAGNGAQTFGTVSAAIGAISGVASGKTCNATDFDLSTADSTVPVGLVADGGTFSASAASNATKAPTITMTDNGANQDGCQGASVALTLTVAQGS